MGELSMEISRQIVNIFYRRREKMEEYLVRVDISPNPLDFDGCDMAEACVIRRDKTGLVPGSLWKATYSERVVLESGHARTPAQALDQLLEKTRATT
jgi:hypothetical protein